MGNLFGGDKKKKEKEEKKVVKKEVNQNDIVKSKLKGTRDKLDYYLQRLQKEQQQINQQILKQKYKKPLNKTKIKAMLSERKQITGQKDQVYGRKKLVQTNVRKVDMQQLDVKMVDALDQTNKHMKQVEQYLQSKNWRDVVAQASEQREQVVVQKENLEDDEQIQKMWKQIGGDDFEQQLNKASKTKIKIDEVKQQKGLSKQQQLLLA